VLNAYIIVRFMFFVKIEFCFLTHGIVIKHGIDFSPQAGFWFDQKEPIIMVLVALPYHMAEESIQKVPCCQQLYSI
jgi:hypothetical protein